MTRRQEEWMVTIEAFGYVQTSRVVAPTANEARRKALAAIRYDIRVEPMVAVVERALSVWNEGAA